VAGAETADEARSANPKVPGLTTNRMAVS
jgi:hypothetical protein